MGRYLAFDLGAESGRAILGTIDGGKLGMEEVHRFPNAPVLVRGTLHWDVLRLYHEMTHALQLCARRPGPALDGVGVDTWGVDFGLLAEDGSLLANPVHYRDHRTDGMMEDSFGTVPREDQFRLAGPQLLPVNTIYQLLALRRQGSPILKQAKTLLMMPDLLRFFMTGRKVAEYTIASTSQLLDMRTREWSRELFERFDLPLGIMPEVVPSGTIVGELPAELAPGKVPVVASGSHDTACAVAAVPAAGRMYLQSENRPRTEGPQGRTYLQSENRRGVRAANSERTEGPQDDWAFISCGTWSVIGVELDEPCMDPRAVKEDFGNEGGVEGTVQLLKNTFGLWILQECRRLWSKQGEEIGYAELVPMAERSKPFSLLVDNGDPSFLNPPDMPRALADFAARTGQKMPGDIGTVTRAILEGLAFRYREIVEELEALSGRTFGKVHMVGGGTRNELLCQFAANAMNRTVIAGPAEATAAGNLLMQAVATGQLDSLASAREVARSSFDLKCYEPRDEKTWDGAYGRMKELAR